MRVELERVGKRFGRTVALREVDLRIEPGERLALIGPNGAGKSTLMRVVMGLVSCTGRVRVDGVCPLRERERLAARMAYVPQIAPRFAAPVGELVELVARLRGLEPQAIAARAAAFELELGALARQPFCELSGGSRQKLLIALALAARASLLVLDEPTASLDVPSRRRFFAEVGALAPQPTLILCSHRFEEIRHLVERVVVLQEGAVVYDGSVERYLERYAQAVLEVRVRTPAAEPWLRARGFRPSAAGWWTRPLANGSKLELLGALSRELGGAIEDVVVRELETIERAAAAPAPAAGPGKEEREQGRHATGRRTAP
ncbi:MAG: hypothetical protein KatS3mg102_2638 [Planctomycetota bacterium]|nr:MAG: hypothetical protein KatS3mg102_2638 [Planctomycetota bacterium]